MRANGFRFIFLLALCPVNLYSQVNFRTVVPRQPVIAGQSFQVQYIVEGTNKTGNPDLPVFTHFRLVSGPNAYHGERTSNYVVTLEAGQPGHFIVPGATITIEGKKIKSDDMVVKVISGREIGHVSGPDNSDYILRPGEDVWKKIRENLFLKLTVDRKKCLVGQPVVATFKLYSRVESKSDITKNPGFYGFSVYDIINLDDAVSGVETLNGRLFDVHTIRKVQLYPLQAGKFIIDAMEIRNLVEFTRSRVYKNTEQEIIEGIVGKGFKSQPSAGTELFETSLHTDPVVILVEPLPLKDRPKDFTGAVGEFRIESKLSADQLKANQQASLLVTITGRGNFTQFGAPEVEWPKDMEHFEARIQMELDKLKIPLEGVSTFIYPFLSKGPGKYRLPPVHFSYFDPGSGSYKTISTNALDVNVSDAPVQQEASDETGGRRNTSIIWIVSGALLVIIAGLSYFLRKKRGTESEPGNLFSAAILLSEKQVPPGEQFYLSLNKAIWDWCRQHLGLQGSDMSKQALKKALEDRRVPETMATALLSRISQAESGIYMGTGKEEDQLIFLQDTRKILETIEERLL